MGHEARVLGGIAGVKASLADKFHRYNNGETGIRLTPKEFLVHLMDTHMENGNLRPIAGNIFMRILGKPSDALVGLIRDRKNDQPLPPSFVSPLVNISSISSLSIGNTPERRKAFWEKSYFTFDDAKAVQLRVKVTSPEHRLVPKSFVSRLAALENRSAGITRRIDRLDARLTPIEDFVARLRAGGDAECRDL